MFFGTFCGFLYAPGPFGRSEAFFGRKIQPATKALPTLVD
jgi:hypothetical protein